MSDVAEEFDPDLYSVSREPDGPGGPDKPWIGRYGGAWVAAADNRPKLRRLLARFQTRLLHPDQYPIPLFMVRTPDGRDHYPTGDIRTMNSVVNRLGHGAHAVAYRHDGGTVVPTGRIVHRCGGLPVTRADGTEVMPGEHITPTAFRPDDPRSQQRWMFESVLPHEPTKINVTSADLIDCGARGWMRVRRQFFPSVFGLTVHPDGVQPLAPHERTRQR